MVKQDIIPLIQTSGHLRPNSFVPDIICPIKIVQIQMSGAPHPHSLWFQNKTFTLRIHHIQSRLFIIKSIWKGPIDILINIFDIQRSNLLILPHDRTFYRVGPRPHVIYIGL